MKRFSIIKKAIDSAIRRISSQASKSLQEADYNAAIAIELPCIINHNSALLYFSFSGCFIHKSPIASFVSSGEKSSHAK